MALKAITELYRNEIVLCVYDNDDMGKTSKKVRLYDYCQFNWKGTTSVILPR